MNSNQGSRLRVTSPEQARPRGASPVQARGSSSSPEPRQGGLYAWTADLEASRDVGEKDQASFAMVLGWMERFRSHVGLAAGREACARFWKEQVLAKPREKWQTEQWAMAIRWYLRGLENRYESGGEVRTLEERVRMAVQKVGTRRGLAPRTRETYGQRVAAYARWAGDERAVMRPGFSGSQR